MTVRKVPEMYIASCDSCEKDLDLQDVKSCHHVVLSGGYDKDDCSMNLSFDLCTSCKMEIHHSIKRDRNQSEGLL